MSFKGDEFVLDILLMLEIQKTTKFSLPIFFLNNDLNFLTPNLEAMMQLSLLSLYSSIWPFTDTILAM